MTEQWKAIPPPNGGMGGNPWTVKNGDGVTVAIICIDVKGAGAQRKIAEQIVADHSDAARLALAEAENQRLKAAIYQPWPAGGVICCVCQGWGPDRRLVIHQDCAFLHAYQDARLAALTPEPQASSEQEKE